MNNSPSPLARTVVLHAGRVTERYLAHQCCGLLQSAFGHDINVWRDRMSQHLFAAIAYSFDGKLIGYCALRSPTDTPPGDCFTAAKAALDVHEFPYELVDLAVSSEARGRHVGLEVVRSLVSHVPLDNVFAITEVRNRASIRIKGILGFSAVGHAIRDRKSDQKLQVFALLRK